MRNQERFGHGYRKINVVLTAYKGTVGTVLMRKVQAFPADANRAKIRVRGPRDYCTLRRSEANRSLGCEWLRIMRP